MILGWECDGCDAADHFLLSTRISGVGVSQSTIAPAKGVCVGLGDATAETYCATVACPAVGQAAIYSMQVVIGDYTSAASNDIAICATPAGAAQCTCTDPRTTTADPTTPTDPTSPAQPPGGTTTPPGHTPATRQPHQPMVRAEAPAAPTENLVGNTLIPAYADPLPTPGQDLPFRHITPGAALQGGR